MALDRKSANARRDLQHGHSPTFVQKREIFERFTCKSKAFEGHLSTPTNRSHVHQCLACPVIIILLSMVWVKRKISVVTVRDFTNFRIPPPLSFELEKISRIFPYPGAENLIHLLVFPTYSPGWPGILPLGEADDMCISSIQQCQMNEQPMGLLQKVICIIRLEI